MDSERGWKQLENGDLEITMSRDDYERLLFALGTALGAAMHGKGVLTFPVVLTLTNRLNAGNPSFTPYEVSDGK